MKRVAHFLLVASLLLLASCHSTRKTAFYRPTRQEMENKYTRSLIDEAYSWIGTPYVWGGQNRNGTDCSGLTMRVFDSALGIKLPRNSREQSDFCIDIDKAELVPGDLVFFHTRGDGKVSHVGMYVGRGYMIHASTHGVMVSALDEEYYRKHFHHCGRVGCYASLIAGMHTENPLEEIIPLVPETLQPVDPAVETPSQPSADSKKDKAYQKAEEKAKKEAAKKAKQEAEKKAKQEAEKKAAKQKEDKAEKQSTSSSRHKSARHH